MNSKDEYKSTSFFLGALITQQQHHNQVDPGVLQGN